MAHRGHDDRHAARGVVFGKDDAFFASGRLDDLASVQAAVVALIDAADGYLLVACVCIVIVVAEVVFFYRRGWLRFGSRHRRR